MKNNSNRGGDPINSIAMKKQTTKKVATAAKVAKEEKSNVSAPTQSAEVKATLKALRATAPIVKLKQSIDKGSVDVFTKSLKLGTLLSARLEAFNAPEFKAFIKANGSKMEDEKKRLWEAVGMGRSYFYRHAKAGKFLIGDADSGEQFIVYREAMLALDERCALDVDAYNAWMNAEKPEASVPVKEEAVAESEGEGDESLEFTDEELDKVAAQFIVTDGGSIHSDEDGKTIRFNGNEQLLKAMFTKVATGLGLVCLSVEEFEAVLTSGVEA